MKKAKYFIKKTTIFFVGVLTVFSMSGLPALAATVIGVTVSETSIQIQFDAQVKTGEGSLDASLELGPPTDLATDLRNYSFESPTEPTEISYPLSRFWPYNQWTNESWDENELIHTITINGIKGLTEGQGWKFSGSPADNPIKTAIDSVNVEPFSLTGNVASSTDPVINTVSPLYAKYQEGGTEITLEGLRFGNNPVIRLEGTELIVTASSTGTVVEVQLPENPIDFNNDEIINSQDYGQKGLSLFNTENLGWPQSVSRPLYIYDSANQGILYGTIKDVGGETPVDLVQVEAYQSQAKWQRYQAQSQANGYFAVVVPAGTYNLEYKTPGSSTGAAPLKTVNQVVTANSATNVGTITFTTALISGYVCKTGDINEAPSGCQAGNGVYGATVTAHDQNWTIEQRATTGTDGSFKLYVTPNSTNPKYILEIEVSDYDKYILGYLNTQQTLNVASDVPNTVKHNLPDATKAVSGTIKTPGGGVTSANPYPNEAVPGANVHLFNSDRSVDMWTQTSSTGQFKLGGITGCTQCYTLEIEPPMCDHPDATAKKYCVYSRTQYTGITVNTDAATDLGVKTFQAPNFFGFVYADANANNQYDFTDANANGKCDAGETTEGVPNVWTQMDQSPNFFTGAQTDACGRYAFYLPNTGTYHLNAFPASDSGYASIQSDVNVSTLPLTSPYNVKLSAPNVSGYVYSPVAIGDVVQGGWVNVEPPPGSPGQWYGGSVDPTTGQFNVSVASDGTYSLRVNTDWNSIYVAPAPYTIVIANGVLTSVTKGETQDSTNDAACDVITKEPWCNSKIIVRLIDPATDPYGFTGTVYDPTGTYPQQNISVSLRIPNSMEPGRWTQTNNQGKFAFGDIKDGTYEIEAMPWGNCSDNLGNPIQCSRKVIQHTISATTRTKNINLTTPNITGTLATPTTSDGNPTAENPGPDIAVPQAWINLHIEMPVGPMGPGGWYGTNANDNGVFSFGGVMATSSGTTYKLEVEPPQWLTGGEVDFSAYSRKSYSVTLYDNDEDGLADATNLNALVGTASTNFLAEAIRVGTPNVKGKILDPDGNAVKWVWVMVHDQYWMNNAGGNTNDEGIFRVGGLADETYIVDVNMPTMGEKALVPPSDLTVTISGGSGTITGTGVTYDAVNKVYIITMGIPKKTISGYVKKADNTPVQYARVEANRDMGPGHFETKTDVNGHYDLLVSQGAWWLNVMPSWEGGNQPDWILNQPPYRIEFTGDNNTPETYTQNFTVQACDSTITGRVMTPGANSQAVQWSWVSAEGSIMGMMGPGMNGSSTDNNGYFTIKVPAGTYNIRVFPNTQNYGSPSPTKAKVASGEIKDVGTIYLTEKTSHIKGFVQDNNGNSLQNIVVNAFQFDGSGWANTFTNNTGAYDLLLTPGTWGLMVMPMSSDYIYQGAPKQITVANGETKDSNNFVLKLANRTIKVKVVDSSGIRITDIFGGVWVRDTSLNDMLEFGMASEDMMQKSGMMDPAAGGGGTAAMGGGGPGMEKGGFTGGGLVNGYTEIKVPAGEYELGLGMPPGSLYVLNATEPVTVSATADPDPVELVVTKKNSRIIGYFFKDADGDNAFDSKEIVTGIRAMINADKEGGGWSMTESNALTGSYSIDVVAGDWYVNAFIDPFMSFGAKKYMIVADKNVKTTVAANDTAERHFQLKELDSTISGNVFLDANDNNAYDAGEGISNAWVFITLGSTAMMDEFKGFGGPSLGTFSDADGAYSLKVAAGTYKVGAGIPPGVDIINPQLQTVTTSATSPGTADLQFKTAPATISGYVYIDADGDGYDAGEEITTGFVRAWSDNNSGKGATVGSDKKYSFKASLDDVWHLEATAKVRTCSTTAATICTNDSDCPSGETCTGLAKFYKSAITDVTTATGTNNYPNKNLKVAQVTVGGTEIQIPESKTVTFDASQSKTIELSDGLKVDIPAQSIVSSGTVTLTITPTVDVDAGSTNKPISFSYEFKASVTAQNEATGQYTTTPKDSDFSSDVTITFPYNEDLIEGAGYTEDEIVPQYYDDSVGQGVWKSYNNVISDTENNTLTVKTDHFSKGGITGSNTATGWVPKVVQAAAAAVTGGAVPPWFWTPVEEIIEKVVEKVEEVKEKIVEKIVEISDGELVKAADSPEIYLIRGGKKIYIPTWEAFVKAGFKWAQVKIVEATQLVQTTAVKLFKTADDPRVYTIKDGKRFHVPSLVAFAAQGFDWKDVTTVSAADRDIYPEITLIKTADDPKVFYISKGLKRHIQNPQIFEKSGYKWNDITNVSATEADGFKATSLIRQIGDPKVYRIETDGAKRWIKTESVFKKLGYNWSDIMETVASEVGAYKTGTEIAK